PCCRYPCLRPPRPLLCPSTTLFRSCSFDISRSLIFFLSTLFNSCRAFSNFLRSLISEIAPTTLTAFPSSFLIITPLSITVFSIRSEEHTSELQSRENLVCRLRLHTG